MGDLLVPITREARGWLSDCGMHMVGEKAVIVTVHHTYEGGWSEFVSAGCLEDPAVVWLLIARKYGLEFANGINP